MYYAACCVECKSIKCVFTFQISVIQNYTYYCYSFALHMEKTVYDIRFLIFSYVKHNL